MDFPDKMVSSLPSTSRALLGNEDVRQVFSVFGDCVMSVYRLDIRDVSSYFSPSVMRMVKSFIADFGVSDAEKIIRRTFREPHCGRVRGEAIGTGIFSKKFRWFARKMLEEDAMANSRVVTWSRL